jgi:hypothetical protein
MNDRPELSELAQRGKRIAESRKYRPAIEVDYDDSRFGIWPDQQTPDPGPNPDPVRGPNDGQQRPIRTISGSGTPSDQRWSDSDPKGSGPGSGKARRTVEPVYADIAAMLSGKLPDSPKPTVLQRNDGHALFYPGQVNLLFGDPEAGKTFIALAAATETLAAGGRVLVIDLDHNGDASTVGRLLNLGAPIEPMKAQTLFRYIEPDDAAEVNGIVEDCETWQPTLAIVDSIGELLPMLGADSNSADDFTRAHTRVLKPLALCGAAVIAVDHPAKNTDSRHHGPAGTGAKRRALGGLSIRVTALRSFTPGKGGTAKMVINKDRHGGVREWCPQGDREPLCGTFILEDDEHVAEGRIPWRVKAPASDELDPDQHADPGDVAFIAKMDPSPTSAEDVRKALRCRKDRANLAWREYKQQFDTDE